VSAANISAVIPTKRPVAMIHPPGMKALMLDGQSTDGRANQARNEMSPSHGGPISEVADGVNARPNAVSHTMPTVR